MKLSWFKETFTTLSYYNIIRRDICSLLFYDPHITKKRVTSMLEITLLKERHLAESNCSTRFCRPLPNRSAKMPYLLCECKGIVFIRLYKIFGSLFNRTTAFRVFYCLCLLYFIVQIASCTTFATSFLSCKTLVKMHHNIA